MRPRVRVACRFINGTLVMILPAALEAVPGRAGFYSGSRSGLFPALSSAATSPSWLAGACAARDGAMRCPGGGGASVGFSAGFPLPVRAPQPGAVWQLELRLEGKSFPRRRLEGCRLCHASLSRPPTGGVSTDSSPIQ